MNQSTSSRNLLLALILGTALATIATAQPAKNLNELGVMAFQAKRYALALEHFGDALKLEPENPSLRRNFCAVHQALASELADAGKIAEALAQVELGLAQDPENPTALVQAGAYALKLGKKDDATARFEAALAKDPANKEALFLLGETCYEQNKLEDARTHWTALEQLDPAWPGLPEKLAKVSREAMVEQDFQQDATGNFALSYAEALSDATRDQVFSILETARTEVGAKLGGAFPEGPVQVVLYDGKQFAEATQTAGHVGALFDGKIRAPVTAPNGRFLDKRVIATRLTHEYVHVALAQAGGPGVPWWLNEGLAEVFSREMDQMRRRALRRIFNSEKATSLRELEARQLDALEPEALAEAYAQAHATASVLWDAGGTEKLKALIQRLKQGEGAEAAIQAVYGLDYPALEQKVAAAFGPSAAP